MYINIEGLLSISKRGLIYLHQTDEHYVRPQAAWERMRAAQNSHQTVYIHGTTGSGKTSFVEDFLARRRYCYIHMADTAIEELAGIAQKEMEKAEKKENAQMIFVIDDLHVLESREEKTICGQLIEQMSVREDIWLILMSREPLPKWLMSAFVRIVFLIIGEQELHLDEEEQESGELILRCPQKL